MDDADRVVVVLGGLALEERVAALGLDEPEAERLRDRRRRISPFAITCMSSSPERPAIASRSANGSSQEYVRVRSWATGETLPTDRVALHAARIRPARGARPARARPP